MENYDKSLMLVKPIDYNKSNSLQYKESIKLLEKLPKESKNFPNVLDIGCGSGNVTKEILSKLSGVQKIFAIDLDLNMIHFAIHNNSAPNIEFVHQDISVPWEQFDARLKSMETKFDLIFANFSMHWIYQEKRDLALTNVHRLLKIGGIYLGNTFISRQIFNGFEKLNRMILSSQEIVKSWTSAAENSGFKLHTKEIAASEFKFENMEKAQLYISVVSEFYMHHLKFGRKKGLRKFVENAMLKEHLKFETSDLNGPVIWSYDTLKIICVKR